jgi:ABC-type multidrug transport system fused ATPase/permease subunit
MYSIKTLYKGGIRTIHEDKENFKLKALFSFFGKKNIIVSALLAILASAVSIFSYVYPMLYKNIIESAEKFKILDFRLLGIYGGLLLIGVIIQYFGTIFFNKFRLNLYYSFRTTILYNFLSLNDREKRRQGIGVYQNRISAELGYAFTVLNITAFKSFILLFRVIFALYVGFKWNIFIGIIFSTNIIMYLLAALIMNKRLTPIYKTISELEPKFNAFLVEFLNGITTILNRRIVNFYFNKHKKLNEGIKRLYFKETVNSETISLIFIDIVHIVSTIFIIGFSLYLYSKGEFTFGLMVATLEYFRYIVDPIDLYNGVYQQYLRSRHFIDMLLPLFEAERKRGNSDIIFKDLRPTEKIIEIKGLTYSVDDSVLIDNVSFDLNKNDKIAIIGQSGEGKSVILDILLKNITDYRGSVKFMGNNIEELERRDILANIGYYSQDIHIFNDNIYSNIFNCNVKNNDMTDDLINYFGLETLKNRDLGESGINISKGEKARIEMLRLILNNKDLIILDEPFEGLDFITKEKILKKFNECIEKKAVIVISHDFDILSKIAKKYILIDNDKKFYIGSHEELYKMNSLYKTLYDSAQKIKTANS